MLAASLQENQVTDGNPTILQAVKKQDQWDLKCRRADENPWKIFFVKELCFWIFEIPSQVLYREISNTSKYLETKMNRWITVTGKIKAIW